jgi:hypothetical protein
MPVLRICKQSGLNHRCAIFLWFYPPLSSAFGGSLVTILFNYGYMMADDNVMRTMHH